MLGIFSTHVFINRTKSFLERQHVHVHVHRTMIYMYMHTTPFNLSEMLQLITIHLSVINYVLNLVQ